MKTQSPSKNSNPRPTPQVKRPASVPPTLPVNSKEADAQRLKIIGWVAVFWAALFILMIEEKGAAFKAMFGFVGFIFFAYVVFATLVALMSRPK